MGTEKKSAQIKAILKALGWSYTTLAELTLGELYDNEVDEIELDKARVKKEVEKIKKHLQRGTSEERLDVYLNVIMEHPDYQALKPDWVRSCYQPHACLSNGLLEELQSFSEELDHKYHKA